MFDFTDAYFLIFGLIWMILYFIIDGRMVKIELERSAHMAWPVRCKNCVHYDLSENRCGHPAGLRKSHLSESDYCSLGYKEN